MNRKNKVGTQPKKKKKKKKGLNKNENFDKGVGNITKINMNLGTAINRIIFFILGTMLFDVVSSTVVLKMLILLLKHYFQQYVLFSL